MYGNVNSLWLLEEESNLHSQTFRPKLPGTIPIGHREPSLRYLRREDTLQPEPLPPSPEQDPPTPNREIFLFVSRLPQRGHF